MRSDNKKGQLTLFIIAGVIIVLGIVLFMTLGNNSRISGDAVSAGVIDSVDSCILSVSEASHRFVSYQGGYNTRPERYFNFEPLFFSYYYHVGESLMPTNRFIEGELGAFVDGNLDNCLDRIDTGAYDLTYTKVKTSATIYDESVEYVVDSVITLSNADGSLNVNLKDRNVFVDSKMFGILEVARFFVADQVEDDEFYCITCVAELAEQYGIFFYLFPLTDEVVLVVAYDDRFDVEDNPVIYNFVNRYAASVLEEAEGEDTA
jgi:hypothetical protein